jgi:hypothetical protein
MMMILVMHSCCNRCEFVQQNKKYLLSNACLHMHTISIQISLLSLWNVGYNGATRSHSVVAQLLTRASHVYIVVRTRCMNCAAVYELRIKRNQLALAYTHWHASRMAAVSVSRTLSAAATVQAVSTDMLTQHTERSCKPAGIGNGLCYFACGVMFTATAHCTVALLRSYLAWR